MTGLALTILLAVVWVGLIAAGFWHGGWRQVVMLAGMLLAYAVASEWAAPNGHDLAAQFHAGIARTTTLIGLLYLVGGTLIVGVLGGFALPRPAPLTTRERGAGAAMGFLNGGLLLALVLRTLRSYAFVNGGGQVLQDSALARFLIERIGYLLILALALGAVAALIGVALGRRSPAPPPALVEEPHPAPAFVPFAPVPAAPEPSPVLPVAVTDPEPVYAHAPLIDWPTTPPPGSDAPGRVPVHAAETPLVAAPGETPNESPGASPVPLVPVQPTVPRRVEPPLVYPVERLLTAPGARVAASLAMPPPAVAPAPPRPFVRPTTPPPGALQPAFVPPTLARTPAQPPTVPQPPSATARGTSSETDTSPPPVREPEVATRDASLLVRDVEVTSPEPPPAAVRELAVATRDAPPAMDVSASADAQQAGAADTVAPDAPKETPMTAVQQEPEQPAAAMEVKTDSAPIPPPLPPVTATRATAPAAEPRTGFARVAVARQAGARPEQPQTPQQAPTQPEPLAPPRPTGPRVHPCPVCGFPVRDHARYCPSCGSRQRA